MKKKTDLEKLNEALKKARKSNEIIFYAIVKQVNAYLAKNKSLTDTQIFNTEIEKITEDYILSGAWITDQLRGYTAITHHHTYKKTLTKKVRKALGYNL